MVANGACACMNIPLADVTSGRLSLADAASGRPSLADAASGRLSLADAASGRLSLADAASGRLSLAVSVLCCSHSPVSHFLLLWVEPQFPPPPVNMFLMLNDAAVQPPALLQRLWSTLAWPQTHLGCSRK